MKKIFLTGASGFLGHYLLDCLTEQKIEVLALSRHAQKPRAGVRWLKGDITNEESILRQDLLDELEDVDVVIHAAALYEMSADHESLYRHNVIGTANVLHLVRHLKKLPHFAFVSSIAIAGNASCNFDESCFDVGQEFPDSYAASKFAAENMVRSADDILSRSIFRLGMLVGSSEDGKIQRLDGPYYIQRALSSLRPLRVGLEKIGLLPLPFHERTRLYFIPVNIAAELIVSLLGKTSLRPALTTFHLIGGRRGVSARRAIKTMLAHYDIAVDPIPLAKFFFPNPLFALFSIPESVGFYMRSQWTFSSNRVEQELPNFRYPSYANYSELIMDYADAELIAKGKDL